MERKAELTIKSKSGNITLPVIIHDVKYMSNRKDYHMYDVEFIINKTLSKKEFNLINTIINEEESTEETQATLIQ